jgi:hypothetical protein
MRREARGLVVMAFSHKLSTIQVTALPPDVRRGLPRRWRPEITGLCPQFGLGTKTCLAQGRTKGKPSHMKGNLTAVAAASHQAAKPKRRWPMSFEAKPVEIKRS